MGITEWFDDRAGDIANLSPGAWTAMAAWLAVCVTIAALVYAWRQFQSAKQETEDVSQPNVAMFMEPSATDWHLVELVVKNFGQKPAYGIKFEFATPPTVPRYESADADNYVDIVPLKLPTEIPYLAPTQEWRTVWDSALDRKQLGESIGSRFAGAVTFYDRPNSSRQGKTKQKKARHQFRTPAVLDWATLHPVERLELLTSHDLARQEKQKLELLRGLLTYYHYATTESRHEALQSEINKINAAANEQRDRYRSQFVVEQEPSAAQLFRGVGVRGVGVRVRCPRPRCPSTSCRRSLSRSGMPTSRRSGTRACPRSTTTRRPRSTRSRRTTTTTPRPG